MASVGKECTFFWFIENFSYCWQRNGESLVSPLVTASEIEGTTWTLKLYPRGYHSLGKTSIALCRNEEGGPDYLTIYYRLSLTGADGSILFSQGDLQSLSRGHTSINVSSLNSFNTAPSMNTHMSFSELMTYCLPKDILTVSCKLSIGEGKADEVAPICVRTRIGVEHISYLHVVESFRTLEPNIRKEVQIRLKKGSIISSIFYCTNIIFYSTNTNLKGELVLKILPSDCNIILAKCELSILDAAGKLRRCANVVNLFADQRDNNIEEVELSFTKNEIISGNYLVSDKLSLMCDCVFTTGIEFQRTEESQNEITETSIKYLSGYPYIEDSYKVKISAQPDVLEALKDAYSNKIFSDVELKTKSKSFPAHKVVLCARSPIFNSMMSHDMKEKSSNSIQVDDLEDDTVEKLLLFLYTDNIKDLQWESAIQLYRSADRYEIEKLRLICSAYLIDNLSTSTATELLLLADAHSDSDLKDVVENFIFEHDKQVFASNEWEALVETNPLFALKIMHLKYKK